MDNDNEIDMKLLSNKFDDDRLNIASNQNDSNDSFNPSDNPNLFIPPPGISPKKGNSPPKNSEGRSSHRGDREAIKKANE